MSRLREAIDSERQTYASARFGGDLGELAQAEPRRRPAGWRVAAAVGVAIAATLLLALVPAEPEVTPQRVAKSKPQLARPRPTLRLSQAGDRATRVEEPRVLVRRRSLKPSRFLDTKPRVVVTPSAVATTTSTKPKPRRRDLSNPSLALRSIKNGIRFGT